MEMGTIKNLLWATAVLGCASVLYFNKERLRGLLTSLRKSKDSQATKEQSGDAINEVYKDFLMYADNFEGLYEPLYKASVGSISLERMKNLLTEWNIRMENIQGAPVGLRYWWSTIIDRKNELSYNELQTCSKKIIQMIRNCGIIRDEASEIIAQDDTNLYYQHIDDLKFETGQKLHVESPCWYLPSNPVRIIEKGFCEIL